MWWNSNTKCLTDQNGIPLSKSELRELASKIEEHLKKPESELAKLANAHLEQTHPQMARLRKYTEEDFR